MGDNIDSSECDICGSYNYSISLCTKHGFLEILRIVQSGDFKGLSNYLSDYEIEYIVQALRLAGVKV